MHSRFLALAFTTGMLAPISGKAATDYYESAPFGLETEYARGAENVATGNWWEPSGWDSKRDREFREWILSQAREEAVAFALYTHHNGVLKLTAQCFPLYPDEPKTAVLEIFRDGHWRPLKVATVEYPGWSLHFRIENWDNSADVPYRVRLGDLSSYEGLIRKDPSEKDTIVVASMSCNSPRDKTPYARTQLVKNLLAHDPDLLFFAGDQTYVHDEHTYGWLQFGVQFRDVMRDRPTICIPDDHDVGHPNLWGDSGRACTGKDFEGGYLYPPGYVNMVQRQQSWSLPDPFDPTPIKQGITVYYTDLTLGGISFAILEDRKFKSPPHPNPNRPGTQLLGERQHVFLDAWARDWTGAVMKVVLSQSPFGSHASYSGQTTRRIKQDHDTNGWPAHARQEAVKAIRRARATHICGDQHLAAVVQYGIEGFRDGPYSFTSPALVNTIWGRWWWPEDEQPGGGDPISSALPWVGDYTDAFGNSFTMMAYANAEQEDNAALQETASRPNRADGYALIRFDKATGDITFECWPRFAELSEGDAAQFAGWPLTVSGDDNDGREPVAFLPEVELPEANAVVEVVNEVTGELIYCHRVADRLFRAPVFGPGRYTLRVGQDYPEEVLLSGVER